jgi:hypothetical protein
MSTLGCLVGTRSFTKEVHTEKNRNQKNSTVSDRESDPPSDSVEFFLVAVFLPG